MIFNMKEKAAKSFGSRVGGQHVRIQIENLLRDRDHIVLDFDGVGVISSSFADEVFGRLFVDMGFRAFTRRRSSPHSKSVESSSNRSAASTLGASDISTTTNRRGRPPESRLAT